MNKRQKIWLYAGYVLIIAGLIMNWYSTPPELGLKLFIGSMTYMLCAAVVMVYVLYLMLDERVKTLEADHE